MTPTFANGLFDLSTTSASYAFDCGTGTNRALIALANWNNDTSDPGRTATYGGVAMTKLGYLYSGSGALRRNAALFFLVNPLPGSNTFAIPQVGGASGIKSLVAAYNNVDQQTPYTGFNSAVNTVNGTTASNTVATLKNDSLIIEAFQAALTTCTPASSQ